MNKLSILIASFMILVSAPIVKAAEVITIPATQSVNASEHDAATKAEMEKAVNEFNSLSKKERKSKFKEVKSLIKDYKEQKKAGTMAESDTNTILLAILAILLPPLAIYLKEQTLTWKFWVSLILIIPVLFGGWGWFAWLAAV